MAVCVGGKDGGRDGIVLLLEIQGGYRNLGYRLCSEGLLMMSYLILL